MSGGNAGRRAGVEPGATDGNGVQDWIAWTQVIVERIVQMIKTDSGPFIVIDGATPFYLQFSWSRDEAALRCEAVSSFYLDDAHQLSKAQDAAMRDMGWHPPGWGDAKNSHNYVRVYYAPTNPVMLAALAGSTLREIYNANAQRLRWRAATG